MSGIIQESNVNVTQELTGRIFNIQKYSIYDGEGIRTLIFLKAVISAARGVPIRKD